MVLSSLLSSVGLEKLFVYALNGNADPIWYKIFYTPYSTSRRAPRIVRDEIDLICFLTDFVAMADKLEHPPILFAAFAAF